MVEMVVPRRGLDLVSCGQLVCDRPWQSGRCLRAEAELVPSAARGQRMIPHTHDRRTEQGGNERLCCPILSFLFLSFLFYSVLFFSFLS